MGQGLSQRYAMSWLIENLDKVSPSDGISNCDFLEDARVIERILTWGILNPFGPTVNSLCLTADPTEEIELIFVKMSNPFAQSTTAYGQIPAGAHLAANAFSPAARSRITAPIIRYVPTFVIPPSTKRIDEIDVFTFVSSELVALPQVDLATEIKRLREHWLDPWARIPSPEDVFTGAFMTERPNATSDPLHLLKTCWEWWKLVTDGHHIAAEWRAIVEAWEGAIGLQRGQKLDALSVSEGLAFHRRLLDQERI